MAYTFKKTDNNRWGIYLKDDLLATVGSKKLWSSVKQVINSHVSNKRK